METLRCITGGWRAAAALMGALIVSWTAPLPGQVFVEDSPAAAEQLAEVEDRLGKGEPEDAARLVQKLIDTHGDALLEVEDGRYAETRRVIAQLFRRRPALYEAYRLLFEPAAAQTLHSAGHDLSALNGIVLRYGLTDSGLDAAMRLAGLRLESGEAQSASTMLIGLGDHPNIKVREALWWELRAASALLLGQRDVWAECRSRLESLGASPSLSTLDHMASSVTVDPPPAPDTPLTPTPTGSPPAPLSDPLWTSVLQGGAEPFVTRKYHLDPNQGEENYVRGRYMNVMPLLLGDRLYVNDGHYLRAFEPVSGRVLWEQRIAEDDFAGGNYIRFSTWMPNGLDLNGIDATDRRVVAIGGYGSMTTPYQWVESSSITTLTCLEAGTGRTLWSLTPTALGEDLADAFWYGRPVIHDDRVFAQLRRRQKTQFQDAYVVAVSLRDGAKLWRRHLASVAVLGRTASPDYAYLTLDSGWLYADSRLGTVARLSADDGAVDWLAVLDKDRPSRAESSRQPWEASAPIRLEAGLVIQDTVGNTVRVMDPATGMTTKSFSAQSWDWPAYFIALPGGDLLSVGQKITRRSGRTLEARWTYDPEGHELRGRVAVTESFVYVPVDGSLRPVRLDSGEVGDAIPIELPANLMILDGQVIAVHRRQPDEAQPWVMEVRSYSTWEAASAQLRSRAARRSDDPHPLMDLAWLAFLKNQPGPLLESLDAVVAMLERRAEPDPIRGEVFDQMLAMSLRDAPPGVAMKPEFFQRLARIVQTPGQEVAYRLALGRYYTQEGRAAQAVEQYQMLLADPVYRREHYRGQGVTRSAALEACDRLRALLKEHPREVYAPYEAYASQRLAELRREVDPEALLELAESHPFTTSAPEALLLAGEQTAQTGDQDVALSILRRIDLYAPDPAQAAEALWREADILERLGEGARARRTLRRLAAAYPGHLPVREGVTVDIAARRARLARTVAAMQPGRSVALPLSTPVEIWPGSVLAPACDDPLATPSGGVVLRRDDRVEFRRLTDLGEAWRHAVGTPSVSLLAADARAVSLWRPESGRLEVLNTADGRLLWAEPNLLERLDTINVPATAATPIPSLTALRDGRVPLAAHAMGEESDDLPVIGDPAFAVNDISVAAADGRGRLVVYDRATGSVRWRAATPVRRLTHVLMDERYIVVAGVDGPWANAQPLFCIYDATTGMLRHRSHEGVSSLQRIHSMAITDEGMLIILTLLNVEAYDPARLQLVWKSKTEDFQSQFAPDGLWVGGGRVVVRTDDNPEASIGSDLLFLNADDGVMVRRTSTRGLLKSPFGVLHDSGQWLLRDADRTMALDGDGAVLWRDAIADPGRLLDMTVSDRQVLILGLTREAELLNTDERRLYLVDRETGRIVGQQSFNADAPIDRLELLGGTLLLTGRGLTAAFAPVR